MKLDDKGRLICTLTNLAVTVGDDGKSISMEAWDKNVDIWSIGESHPLVLILHKSSIINRPFQFRIS